MNHTQSVGATARQIGAAAAANARVIAAISYLRLLTALVTRAPSPDEAAARARLLLAALVNAVGTQSRSLNGRIAAERGAGAATKSIGISDGDGIGVEVRSMASDSAVLCTQTLRFLLDWAEQSPGGGNGTRATTTAYKASATGAANIQAVCGARDGAAEGAGIDAVELVQPVRYNLKFKV